MDVSNSRLDKAEQRLSELKDRSEEITPNAAQKDKERENMKENLRGMEGRLRESKLPYKEMQKEKNRENVGMAIFNFPELMEDIHPRVKEIWGVLRRTYISKSTFRYVMVTLDSKKHNQSIILPMNVWESSWITEA